MQKQSLGDRMKGYEDITRYQLPRKSFVLARIDGKAFHTYTRGLDRPFDEGFIEDMNETAIELCKQIQNAKFAYVQSDEISILIHETEMDTDPWFDNTVQKMGSVAASIATAKFNKCRIIRDFARSAGYAEEDVIQVLGRMKTAHFDARFWTIPTVNEVVNYFMWRQQDATKNSISAVAQANFSHKMLEGVDSNKKQDMLFLEKGINWNDFPVGQKRGRFIEKVQYEVSVNVERLKGDFIYHTPETQVRNRWAVTEPPIFSQDREFLLDRIKVNY